VDPAREVLGLADRRDQLEVADALPDRDVQLVSEDKADEGLAVPQAPASVSRSESRVKRTRPSEPALSSSAASSSRPAPSSWAVRTSTPRTRSPSVMARGTWTSM